MNKRFMGLGMLGAFLLAAAPAFAQGVDDKIKALEQELSQLKEQQIELKKDATAAAAAMPDFTYRPGAGLAINAADQSWGFRAGYEFALDMMKLEGNDDRREGDWGLFGRRNRPQFTYTVDRGFYEFAAELDMDGDETGGKHTLIQRACFRTRMEQINPFLPTVQVGMDCSGAGSRYRSSEMTFELPTLDRNNGFNTGSHTGIGLNWSQLPPFFPGTHQFNYYAVLHGMGLGDGVRDESNRIDHVVMYNINPFSEIKNKWISGVGLSMFAWFGNPDDRPGTNTPEGFSTHTFQLRSQEGSRRVVIFTSPTAARGDHLFLSPSAQYKVGPYQINGVAGWDRYDSDASPAGTKMKGRYWKVMNDLMLWSPKGFLTGAPNETGTLGLGYSYERTTGDCDVAGCDAANGGNIKRATLIVNEGGLRYWLRPSLSLHLAVKHYATTNTPAATQVATGCSSNNNATNPSKDCSWVDMVLRLYFIF
jgi:hypothetical protein